MTSLTLVRKIAARPSIVFDALITPEGVSRWWGPDAGPVLEGLDGMTAVAVHAKVAGLDGWTQAEYRDLREVPATVPPSGELTLLAIPYFAWANRGTDTMRVWIPNAD